MRSVLIIAALLLPAAEPDATRAFPAFAVDNFDGRKLTEAMFEGKTTLVVPTFAKCIIACPLVTLLLRELDESLGSPAELQYLHVSVNPQWDTAEEIRSHFKDHELDPERDPRWLFANGSSEDIARLLDAIDIEITHQPVAEGVITEHTLRVIVVGPRGRILDEFDNYFWDEKEMHHALRYVGTTEP